MADFNVTGLDDVMKEMMSHQQAAETAIPEMLNAGADILVKAQKAEMESMKIRQQKNGGDTIKSIKASKIKKDKDGNSYIDVSPQGKNRRGGRNADVAFVNEYGKSNQDARPWMRTANAKCSDEITEKEKEIWDKNKGG